MNEREILARELEKADPCGTGNATMIHFLRDPNWKPHGMWPAILEAIQEGYVQGRNYTHDNQS